jgi:protein ImuA
MSIQTAKAHIIFQLQKEILLLQGFKPASAENNDAGLGLISHAFPNATFPLGALHEFHCTGAEEAAVSSGFIAAILSSLMKTGTPSVWISPFQSIFPPALKSFGIEPHKIIFIQSQKPKEILWLVEETLKCNALCAVVGEVREISFTESRRLQLAVEQTKVTCFLLRQNPANLATSSVTKWRVKPLPTGETILPGIGFPRWNVELLKVRNGKPGSWRMEWRKGRFQLKHQAIGTAIEEQRKIV